MQPKAKTSGRPFSAETSAALKAHALRLVREHGYAKVSIAKIAAAAGVARQTLYNRWNTKADLVLEAIFDATADYVTNPDDVPGADCRARLEGFLSQILDHLNNDGDIMCALIAAAQDDPAFRAAYYDRFVKPREIMVTDLLRQAQACGELSPDRDPNILSAFVHGAFWYRMLNGQPIDAQLARDITAQIFAR